MDKVKEILKIELPKIDFAGSVQLVLSIMLTMFVGFAIYYLIYIGNKYVVEGREIKLNKKKIFNYLLVFVGALVCVKLLKSYNNLRYLLNAFITSIILAYVINPLVGFLEKKFPKVKRKYIILIIYVFIFITFVFIFASFLPRTVAEFKKLINNFPAYVNQARDKLVGIGDEYFGSDILNLKNFNISGLFDLFKIENSNISGLMGGVKTTFSKLFMAILVPIFVFYFLNDKEKFVDLCKDLIPKKYRNRIVELGRKMDSSVFKYIKGRILMAVYVGVVVGISLTVLGVDFALIIGIITMLADIIPYVGPLIGFIPAIIFALLDSPIKAIWVIILFPFVQWTENNIVGPKIMSDQLGIHAIVVLIATLVGGFLFGFVGMILALPVLIAILVIFDDFKERKNKKNSLITDVDKLE